MVSTAKLSNNEYNELLQVVDFQPASYEEVAESLMKNGVREMYHAMVNELDIGTLLNIPNLKIFGFVNVIMLQWTRVPLAMSIFMH